MRRNTRHATRITPMAVIVVGAIVLVCAVLLTGCEWLALGSPLRSSDDAAIAGGPDDDSGGSGDSDDTEDSPDDSAETYTVTYDANGATSGSAPADQTKTPGVALTLAGNSGGLAKSSYNYAGWNTAPDGSGTDYAEGATYSDDADVTLYAEWTINTYTVTFDGNGHDGGSVPSAITDDYNTSVSLPGAGTMTRTEATFVGWNTASDGSGTSYGAGASYTIGAAHVTLYAEWDINRYTVIYDANGFSGSVPVDSTQYEFGSSVTISDNTGGLAYTADGFDWLFDGWNTASDGSGIGYAPGETETMPSGGLHLYAQFTAIGATGPAGGYVFYDDQMLGAPVNLAGARYLEAAPVDINVSGDYTHVWGGYNTSVGGTDTAMGTGQANTTAIVAAYGSSDPWDGTGNYAARLCDQYTYGGYSDWFLPSLDELDLMYDNKGLIGGFESNEYWSSSEDSSFTAGSQDFSNGSQYADTSKNYNTRVRAVRAF